MNAKMVFFSLLLGSLMAGCSSSKSYHVSKDYKGQAPTLRKVGVVIAQAEIRNLSLSGYRYALPDIDKSAQSKKFFESAIVNEFNRKGYSAVLLAIDDDLRALINQYDNTRPNIHQDWDIDTIPNLPSTVPVITRADVDAVAIIWALDNISTNARKTMNIVSWVLLQPTPGGKYFGELLLLDKSGKRLFYNLKTGTEYNLTEEDDVSRICSELVSDLEAIKQ
jgi:hypothetical protein